MNILPKTIYLTYPTTTIKDEDLTYPDRVHLRGCKVITSSKDSALISSEYDEFKNIVFELTFIGENVAKVVRVNLEDK